MKTQIFKIKRVPYTQLLKSEMADYVEKTIAIVDKHEPELALFNPLFEELSDKESDIHLLRLDHGIDLERLRAYKLKEELNLTISAFKLKVRIISKSTPKLEIHILENAINKHLRHLHKCKNNHVYNQRVSGFFDLYQNDLEMQEAIAKDSANRLAQVGTGDRSGRIRTYNYPQNRMSDHRIGVTLYRLAEIMQGGLMDEIVEPLIADHQSKIVEAAGL